MGKLLHMAKQEGYTRLGNLGKTNKLYKRGVNYNIKEFRRAGERLKRKLINLSTSQRYGNTLISAVKV